MGEPTRGMDVVITGAGLWIDEAQPERKQALATNTINAHDRIME